MRQSTQIILVAAAVGAVYVGTHGDSIFGIGISHATSLEGLSNFDGVELAGSDDVIIKQGARYEVRAEGDPKAVRQLQAQVSGGVLHLSREHNWSWSFGNWGDKGVVVHVTLPTLNRVVLKGSGDLSADKLSGQQVSASLKGSGDLNIGMVDADKAEFSLAGSGDLRVGGGKARTASYSLAGSGDLDVDSMDADEALVDLKSSGGIKLRAHKASGALRGSGNIDVDGAQSCNIAVHGSGNVDCS